MAPVLDFVSAIRTVRSESRISPAVELAVTVKPAAPAVADRAREQPGGDRQPGPRGHHGLPRRGAPGGRRGGHDPERRRVRAPRGRGGLRSRAAAPREKRSSGRARRSPSWRASSAGRTSWSARPPRWSSGSASGSSSSARSSRSSPRASRPSGRAEPAAVQFAVHALDTTDSTQSEAQRLAAAGAPGGHRGDRAAPAGGTRPPGPRLVGRARPEPARSPCCCARRAR